MYFKRYSAFWLFVLSSQHSQVAFTINNSKKLYQRMKMFHRRDKHYSLCSVILQEKKISGNLSCLRLFFRCWEILRYFTHLNVVLDIERRVTSMHKSYQPIRPASNRLLQKKWDEKYHSEHQILVRAILHSSSSIYPMVSFRYVMLDQLLIHVHHAHICIFIWNWKSFRCD